jgi:PBSX family phage portal protein
MALKVTPGTLSKLEKPQRSTITFIQQVIKGETYLVMAQSKVELEDEFSHLYFTTTAPQNLFLQPPFDPNVLLNLVQTNNILNQCIEAMEVNIDGTGIEFEPLEEGGKVSPEEEKAAKQFFNEPYPNISFVSLRRKLRRQMESIGYGFIEILRNVADDVVSMRNVETPHIRMCKLDKPIRVKKMIERDGKEVELELWVRERRFAQMVGLKDQVYFREFGATRQLHRTTGEWEEDGKAVKPEDRASELLILGINPDITTPYFLPRWINNLPSVIGSRHAEEQNLQFLDAGGLPPAIVFVQGGTIIKDASDQLRMYLSGMNKNKNRAVVVEVQSSSGSLDASGKVDVKVERFGSAASNDSMFQKYDEATEEHVRTAFRLPPLFLGKADDYNFATARTAYMVAEAQVFGPERTEFDEVMNKTIIKAIGWETLRMRSKPITLKDVEAQLQGLTLAKDVATRETFLKEVNAITDLSLDMAEVPAQGVGEMHEPLENTPTADEMDSGKLPAAMAAVQPAMKPAPEPPGPDKNDKEMKDLKVKEQREKLRLIKGKKTANELIDLVHDYATMKGLVQKRELTPETQLLVEEAVDHLDSEDRTAFNRLFASYVFGGDDPDLQQIVEFNREA